MTSQQMQHGAGGEASPPRRQIRVSPLSYGLLVLVLFLGSIGAAQLGGIWVSSSHLNADGTPVELSGNDPNELRGWMPLEQVLQAYQVPRASFDTQFQVPPGVPGNTPLKELEQLAPDFSVPAFRAWLTERAAQTP